MKPLSLNKLYTKKNWRYVWFILVLFAFSYSMFSDWAYIFDVLSYTLSLALVTFMLVLLRNICLPMRLVKYRFYWMYPTLTILGILFFYLLKIVFQRADWSEKLVIFILVFGLGFGIIWGIIERVRLKTKLKGNRFVERAEFYDPDDVEDEDEIPTEKIILVVSEDQIFKIKSKNEVILEIPISDLKNIAVHRENKIIVTHLSLTLKNNEELLVDSAFPYVWKKALSY